MDGGRLTLAQATITTSGNTSSNNNSSFYDLNATVLAKAGNSIALSDSAINTMGTGANGAFAAGSGALVTLTMMTITADGGYGVMATGGTLTKPGQDSPSPHSTSMLTASGATCVATGSEMAAFEGANAINLTNAILSSSKDNKWGIMIAQSMSGDAEGTQGVFTMSSSALAYTSANGPLF